MGSTVTHKLIERHLTSGSLEPGSEIAIRVDQTLTQDATGTLVMLELEALDLDRVKTDVSVQYVDHNLLQTDARNADDHLFLYSAAQRFGLWFSKPGNGVSHPVHMQRFGKPGATMVGSDSHTPAAGALGMLAIGVGGLEVALAMAGEPLHIQMPQVWGVELTGELPPWVSAKDVILEMLRRHDVKGGVGRIIEYHGPGLAGLSAMDRHVIANMGAELGATTTVFPSDEAVRSFLAEQQREDDWVELVADPDASYDVTDAIDLSALEPLIAKPSSPGNVVPVREVAGEEVAQVCVGSSANPGTRDFAVVAATLAGRQARSELSLDVNPTSRQVITDLIGMDLLVPLIQAGARLHQAGCNGCIGMGQAPATGRNSLRTFPRNFPGRSGTKEDSVWLCSPETAVAAALTGRITDPRELGVDYPKLDLPARHDIRDDLLVAPLPVAEARQVELVKGPNISAMPDFQRLADRIEAPVELKIGDNVSTDAIMPAGARVLPYRSNIPKISEFCFYEVDADYASRVAKSKNSTGHVIVGGENYGQGSSREHAAIAPRYLGLRAVIAKSFARIHWQNLANFGVLALEFADPADYDAVAAGDVLAVGDLRDRLRAARELTVENTSQQTSYAVRHRLSGRQVDMVLAGGLIPLLRQRLASADRLSVRFLSDRPVRLHAMETDPQLDQISRTDPPLVADERVMLVSWLDYHRATLARKCAGLSAEQLRERAAPPSGLSLLGLVRHMADVERGWFRRCVGGEDASPIFYSAAEPDGDFDWVADADPQEAFTAWLGECEHARDVLVACDSLERTVHGRGKTYSVRWIVVHMIEEYARHNGHADLLRERLDGSVGD